MTALDQAPALTTADVATRLACTVPTVRAYIDAGRLPGAFRLGTRWRIPESAVSAFRSRDAVRDSLSPTDLSTARRSPR